MLDHTFEQRLGRENHAMRNDEGRHLFHVIGRDESRAAHAGCNPCSAQERERMTLVVTKLYFNGGRAKIEVRLARGKKQYDKRQALRQRDAANEARTAIRNAKRGPS